MNKTVISALLLICLALPATAAQAAPLVLIYANSAESFGILGNNFDRVLTAKITINYQRDESDTRVPFVGGSPGYSKIGTLTSQVDMPGQIVINITAKKPMSGYVPLAYAQIPGVVTNLTGRLYKDDKTEVAVQGSIRNPTREQLDEIKKKQQDEKTGNPDKSDPVVEPETNPAGPPAKPRQETAPTSTERPERSAAIPDVDQPAPLTTESKSGVETAPSHAAGVSRKAELIDLPLRFSRKESLLDRFTALSGERTAAALARLLPHIGADFRQDPPLLISDGTAMLRLSVRVMGRGPEVQQFSISGGNCTELKVGENGTWILEIIPERGVLTASVTVLAGRDVIEYPLAVAPPLEIFNALDAKPCLMEFVRAANELVRAGGVR